MHAKTNTGKGQMPLTCKIEHGFELLLVLLLVLVLLLLLVLQCTGVSGLSAAAA